MEDRVSSSYYNEWLHTSELDASPENKEGFVHSWHQEKPHAYICVGGEYNFMTFNYQGKYDLPNLDSTQEDAAIHLFPTHMLLYLMLLKKKLCIPQTLMCYYLSLTIERI